MVPERKDDMELYIHIITNILGIAFGWWLGNRMRNYLFKGGR